MLFRKPTLDGIRSGAINVAFRQWRRPTVKAGGSLLTPAGQLRIEAVDRIEQSELSERDARQAGFQSLDALLADLGKQSPGRLYRIELSRIGPDPREALRQKVGFTTAEREALDAKLERLDQRSGQGAWTRRVMGLIAAHPETSARELALLSGHQKDWLKINIRKLKNLGLTESLDVGYRLSPRGETYLSAQSEQ